MLNSQDMISYLHTLFDDGDVFEIRILSAMAQGSNWEHTESGYFDYKHIDIIPNLIANFKSYSGVYVTLNPVIYQNHPHNKSDRNNNGCLCASCEHASDCMYLKQTACPVSPHTKGIHSSQ